MICWLTDEIKFYLISHILIFVNKILIVAIVINSKTSEICFCILWICTSKTFNKILSFNIYINWILNMYYIAIIQQCIIHLRKNPLDQLVKSINDGMWKIIMQMWQSLPIRKCILQISTIFPEITATFGVSSQLFK